MKNLRKLIIRTSDNKEVDLGRNRRILRREFDKIDVDGDGKIEKDEFCLAFDRLGWGVSGSVLHEVVNSMDSNGDGCVSFNEFIEHVGGASVMNVNRLVTMLRDRILEKAQKCSLQRCFNDIDTDGDGKVDHDEFYDGVKDYGLHFTKKERRNLWEEFDVSHTGQISFHEFWKCVTENWSEADHKAELHVKTQIRRLIKEHTRRSRNSTEDVVEDLFNAIDVDNDGKIEMDEFGTTRKGKLAKSLYRAMAGITEMQKRRIFYKIDKSGDGLISMKELKRFTDAAVGK